MLGGISPEHDSTTAAVGSSMPFKTGYAAIHQFGGKAGRGKGFTMPARPFFELADENMEDIKDDKSVLQKIL
ncbi:MAG TPA: phage virion morphogenesis protein [Candidatus Eremiobacteraeota bacterium]|nr:phage virion morphogenesis protein [Candidatus Eremiobacteraeota bacterium]